MVEAAKRKERKGRAIALGLVDALRMVEQIHRQGAGSDVPKTSLGHILGSKPTSSLFDRKVAALKSYGLIETRGEMIALTPLGKTYAMPTSAEEKSQIALQAFREVSLFDRLLSQYNGNPLPEINQFFYNQVASTYGISNEEVAKWIKEFMGAARHTGCLVSEQGHDVVRLPDPVGAPLPQLKGDAPTMNIQETQESFEMVSLRIEGAQMTVNVPDKVDPNLLKETIGATEDALELLRRKWKRLTGQPSPTDLAKTPQN